MSLEIILFKGYQLLELVLPQQRSVAGKSHTATIVGNHTKEVLSPGWTPVQESLVI